MVRVRFRMRGHLMLHHDAVNGATGAAESRRWPVARLPASALVFMAAALLLFTRLSCPLLEPEETRYAEIPRQMLSEGRFVTPVWHGEAYWHKPPLFYWIVM